MRVKSKKIYPSVVSVLSDMELISACSYCNKLLNPQTLLQREEFEDLCFYFFDGDYKKTTESIEYVKSLYTEEFSKRHIN